MQSKKNSLFVGLLLPVLLSGCAITQAPNPIDPWENWNRKVQYFNDEVDEYAMIPVAKAYRWITPVIIDGAISRVFSNIDDIGVTINTFLQGKFLQSGLDASRFIVNSTVGVAGIIDVASMIDLPKHKEDFGQTLGYWGVPTGPYMVLPLFGPSSPRGVAGLVGDAATNPISYLGSPYISSSIFAVNAIDTRADSLSLSSIADEAITFDRYEYFRSSYIAQRKSLVLDGEVSEDDELIWDEEFDEDFDEEEEEEITAPINPL